MQTISHFVNICCPPLATLWVAKPIAVILGLVMLASSLAGPPELPQLVRMYR